MTIDEGLALASYTRGIDHDGWIQASAELGVIVYCDIEQLHLLFWIPDDFVPRDVVCSSTSDSIAVCISPGVLSEVKMPCQGAMTASKISIRVSPTTIAGAGDARLLGAVLVGIKSS